LLSHHQRRLVNVITVAVFLVALAGFAGVLLAHGNTLAIVEPFVRWVRPSASFADIAQLHNVARKFGHFLIPAVGFSLLVLGPLRRRPRLAFALCVLFAAIDESLQTFLPGRNGSLSDVLLDTSGAVFAYFTYRAIVSWRQ